MKIPNPLTGRLVDLGGRTTRSLVRSGRLVMTPDRRLLRPEHALLEARAPAARHLPTTAEPAFYLALRARLRPIGAPAPQTFRQERLVARDRVVASLSDADVDALMSDLYGAPAVYSLPIEKATNLPSRADVRRVLAEIFRDWAAVGVRTPALMMGSERIRGRYMEERVGSIFAAIVMYDGDVRDAAGGIVVQVYDPATGITPDPRLDDADVFPVGGDGTCFLECAAGRWPSLKPLCDRLRSEWAESIEARGGVTADQVRHFVVEARSRRGNNHPVGVELRDRAGNPWWSYNVDGLEAKRVLRLTAGCHHVQLAGVDELAWDGTCVDLEPAAFRAALREGRWARYIHDGAFIPEDSVGRPDTQSARPAYRDAAMVARIRAEAPRELAGIPFEQLHERHPLAASFEGVIAAEFRARSGAEGLVRGSPLERWLSATQVEHAAAEFAPVDPERHVCYDMNDCFAAYGARGTPVTPYYQRYGLPHLPTLGGVLPADLTPAEQDALLGQTGFGRVEDVELRHWSLEQFPYLVAGRAYPTAWLRFVADRGLAGFRLAYIALAGSFYESEPISGGKVLRKVIGRWIQKEATGTLYAKDRTEAERLSWSLADKLKGLRTASDGGFLVDTAEPAPMQYPHIRSFALAYAHIGLFDKLLQVPRADVVAVKTDSLTLRRPAAALEKAILPGLPGRWKREEPKAAGYGRSRLEAAKRKMLETPPPEDPDELLQNMGVLVRGAPGARPVEWETAWRYTYRRSVGEAVVQKPLVILLSGAGGFGKTSFVSNYFGTVALSAFMHDTLDLLREKFPGAPAAATVHSWALGDPLKMRPESLAVRRAPRLLIDEASMLAPELVEAAYYGPRVGKMSFIAGDLAQCPPVVPTASEVSTIISYPPRFGGFEIPTAHTIRFTKDYRSCDEITAQVKAEVRRLRLEDASHACQLAALIAKAAELGRPVRVLAPNDCVPIDEAVLAVCQWGVAGPGAPTAGVVLAGRRETRDRFNRLAMEAARRCTYAGKMLPLRARRTTAEVSAGARQVVPYSRRGLLGGANPTWELGAASTVHAYQGRSIASSRPVVYVDDGSGPGVLYTALSRVECLDQLTLMMA